MKASKLDSFVTLPRKLSSDFKGGALTRNELILLLWLRLNANPYGISSVNISSIQQDMFPDVSENYVQKLMLSLRSKRCVYFKSHKGRRGSFEVHLGDWPTPKGFKTLDNFFRSGISPSERIGDEPLNPEASQRLEAQSQRLNKLKEQMGTEFKEAYSEYLVTGSYTDTDKDTNTDTIDSKTTNEIKVETFKPGNREEARCFEIARALREPDMNYILAVLHRSGLNVVERAFGIYKEQYTNGGVITNPGAYFNSIVKQIEDENKPRKAPM